MEKLKSDLHNSELPISGIKKLDNTARKILKIDRKRAHVVIQYFKQMSRNFELMHKYLIRGSRYVCVVGNSHVAGIWYRGSFSSQG